MYNPSGPQFLRTQIRQTNQLLNNNNYITAEPNIGKFINTYNDAKNLATKYRVAAASMTSFLDCTDLTNQGTVFAVQQANAYQHMGAGSNVSAIGGAWSTTLQLPRYNWMAGDLDSVSPQVLGVRPGCISRAAKLGDYTVLRSVSGDFEWQDANPVWIGDVISALSTTQSYSPYPSMTPSLDTTVGLVMYSGLDPKAKIIVRTHTCYEFMTDIGSPLQSFIRTTSEDQAAMALYKSMTKEWHGSYPSDWNDWGTIWNGVKNLWNKTRGGIATAAGLVPEIGGPLAALIRALPNAKVSNAKRPNNPKPKQKSGNNNNHQPRRPPSQKKGRCDTNVVNNVATGKKRQRPSVR